MKIRLEKDSIDLEQLKDCVRQPGFRMIEQRMASMLESMRSQLEHAADAHEFRFVQGQIDCLRTCLQLPQIIHDEIRAKQRRNPIAAQ
jgi:hypothetical protein